MADVMYDPADKPLAAKVARGNIAVNKPEAVTVTGYEANVNGAGQPVLKLVCYPVGKPAFQEALMLTSDHLGALMTAEQYDALPKQEMQSCDVDIELLRVAGFSLNPYRVKAVLRGEIVVKQKTEDKVEKARALASELAEIDTFLKDAPADATVGEAEAKLADSEALKPDDKPKCLNDWALDPDKRNAFMERVEYSASLAGVDMAHSRAWALALLNVPDETQITTSASEALKVIRAALPKPEPAPEPKREVNMETGEITTPAQPAALVPYQPQTPALLPEQAHWTMLREQAAILLKSGFLPQSIKTPEQAIAIMMMGEALGVKPIVALSTINVIQGKPTIPPQLMLAKVRQSGQLEDLSVTDDGTSCTVVMKRKGETPHTETFSMTDAGNMGLSGKDNWRKQPAVMRKWRAVSAACRVVFPDIIWGLYTPEEMNPDIVIED